MLKITADRHGRRLVLEGSLAGPWVDTFADSWRDALAAHDARDIAIDLSEVTYIDSRGRHSLALMHKAGAVLLASGNINGALIQEIARDVDAEAGRGPSRSLLWLLAGIIPALALGAACSRVSAVQRPATEAVTAARPAIPVTVAPVTAGAVIESVEVIGSLSPKSAADVKSEVSGIVTAVYVTEWVPVRRGAPLARLNTSENEAALEAMRATEAQARVAAARARREHDRALSLKEYGLITLQAVDDARSALEAADAAAGAAGAQVRAAEARLAKAFIAAPIDGIVALRGVNVGDRVENIGGGAPLFRIVDNRVLDVTVAVPSTRIGGVSVGQALEFGVDAIPGRTFTATVKFINPAVDELSRAGRVVAEVRNAEGLLKGGLFVKGRIVTGRKRDALQVPRAALLNWNVAGRSAEVIVVHGINVEVRTVTVGADTGGAVVIDAGVVSGEQVVVRGGFAIKAGDHVSVVTEGV